MRFLIVEDSATMRAILRGAFEELGYAPYEVLEAGNGAQAIETLKRENLEIDLILTDWDMPEMDGLSFLKQVAALSPLREIPTLMVTSRSEREGVVEALRHGAKDYLIKPFNADMLRQKLEKILAPVREKHREDTTVLLRQIAAAATEETPGNFLGRLPADLRQELLKGAVVASYEPGAVILAKGQPVDFLHLLTSGEADVEPESGEPEQCRTGDCLGALEFMSGAPARGIVRARGRAQVSSVPRLRLGEILRRHEHLSFLLTDLIVRRQTARRPAPAKPEGLTGRLSTLGFPEVIQMVESNARTGTLEFRSGTKQGGIYFEEGRVLHAWVGDRAGEPAFYEIMKWNAGAFSFRPERQSFPRSISLPTMTLLMEGARLLDEQKK